MPDNPPKDPDSGSSTFSMPIRKLCNAAYRHEMLRGKKSNIQELYHKHCRALYKQICKQCCRKSYSIWGYSILWGACRLVYSWKLGKVLFLWCRFILLAKHQFGNYVIQSMMNKISSNKKALLRNTLKSNASEISNSQYGRHVLLQLERPHFRWYPNYVYRTKINTFLYIMKCVFQRLSLFLSWHCGVGASCLLTRDGCFLCVCRFQCRTSWKLTGIFWGEISVNSQNIFFSKSGPVSGGK